MGVTFHMSGYQKILAPPAGGQAMGSHENN